MTREEEDDLLRQAAARGWLTPADLERLDRDRPRGVPGAQPRVDLALRRGLLDTKKLGELAPANPPPPVESFGRFILLGKLGAGGSATVFRARDPQLDREVAIKVLAQTLGEGLDLVEARTQARVQHEHVCKVFEVGEIGGRPYIVMQLVEGTTLRVAAHELRLEQKVALMAQAADAVHAAHRIGLVHRDLKPSNIMVERDANGWRPYVMDFGVAREAGTQRTATAIVGTPPYMAPEQARGDGAAIDRRTDVYGLGATLYEVLTGEPPFSGDSSTAVLVRVLTDEPTPPRHRLASLPRDLETVVLKCLEKDPARRYDSARALAEDLERFLDGEPVLARRASLGYRSWKLLRKHRVTSAVLLMATAILVAAAVLVVDARRRGAADAAAAQRFGEEVKNIETVTRLASMAPLHDVRGERELVRARMAAVEAQLPDLGAAGRAAGHYALGRGHLALDEPTQARAELEAAWQLGDRRPATALALAEALGALYEEELRHAGIGRDDVGRAVRLAEINLTLLEPARWYLRVARGARILESAAFTGATIDYLERRYPEAVEGAHRAAAEVPWLYEAPRLEGDAHRALADVLSDAGDYDGALAELDRAGACYVVAMNVARADPRTRRAELLRRIDVIEIRLDTKGGVTRADFEPLSAALADAKIANPDAVGLHSDAASIELRRALFLRDTDPAAAMAAVDLAISEANLERDPFVKAQHLATANWTRGGMQAMRGEDPRAALWQAVRFAEEALARQPSLAQTHNTAGLALRAIADHEDRLGGDPRPALELALVHYRRVAELHPTFVGIWNNLGRTLAIKAEYQLKHGLDATDTLDEMLGISRRGMEADRSNSVSVNTYGNALNLAAWAELQRGGDPRALLRDSDVAYARAAELNPTYAFPFGNRGGNALLRAEYLEETGGGDPAPSLAEARELYNQAVAINPKFANGHLGLADALARLGDLDGARAALARAAELRPGDDRQLLVLLRIELAEAKGDAGADEPLRRAETAFDEACAARPGIAELHAARAELHLARAALGATDQIAHGLAATARALAIDGKNKRALRVRAALLKLGV